MGSTIIYVPRTAVISYNDGNYHYEPRYESGYESGWFVAAAGSSLQGVELKKIVRIRLYVYAVDSKYIDNPDFQYSTSAYSYKTPVDIATVSRDNRPSLVTLVSSRKINTNNIPGYLYLAEADVVGKSSAIVYALLNGFELDAYATSWSMASGEHPPYFEVEYEDALVGLIIGSMSIVGGKLASLRRTKLKFWQRPASSNVLGDIVATSAKFEWRVKGSSSSNIVNLTLDATPTLNSTVNATAPRINFPVGTIEWRVVVTSNDGAVTTSSWAEAESVAPVFTLTPDSGYVPNAQSNVFAWSVDQGGVVDQSSATLQWRVGASGSINSVSIASSVKFTTLPANTFPAATIQWRVVFASSDGGSAISDWVSISTAEVAATAEVLEPDGSVIESTSPIPFRWSHIIETGTAQTKAELQWSADKSTWTALATVTGSAQSWTAPANTFTAGTRYWRVRTYNSDNVASAWSDAATFICVGAPAAPVVVIQELSPRPKISWQVEGQQAYQVELVGVYADGTRFGTDKQWQSPLYLTDGDYTVRVRVQNEYGFWSAWGAAPLQIINTPGSTITLTAEAGREVTLAWQASGFDYYIVYRDGVPIARTAEPLYTDRTSIGQIKYQVRGCYASSANYSLSAAVTVTVGTPSTCLYDLDAEQWVDLRHDASAHRSTAYSLARDIQYLQLSGRAYPVAERSEFLQRSLHVACVCFTAADRARMLSILGHLVCVKTPEGNMVMGYVANLSETSDDFFSTYGFDVAQADVKEEIDIDEA